MTLIAPSKANHTTTAAMMLNHAMKSNRMLPKGKYSYTPKAFPLALNCKADGTLLSDIGHERIVHDNIALFVFSDMSAIVARRGHQIGYEKWFAMPQVYRIKSKPNNIVGKLICSTLGGRRGNPRLCLASPTWPKGDCEANAIFSSYGFADKKTLAPLQKQILQDMHAIATQIETAPFVSDQAQYLGGAIDEGISIFVPDFATLNWSQETTTTQIQHWATAFLSQLDESYGAELSMASLIDGQVSLKDTMIYNVNVTDKKGLVVEDKALSQSLRTFLLSAPWGGKATDLVEQDWIQNSALRNPSRMRSKALGRVHKSDPTPLSAHDVFTAAKAAQQEDTFA